MENLTKNKRITKKTIIHCIKSKLKSFSQLIAKTLVLYLKPLIT